MRVLFLLVLICQSFAVRESSIFKSLPNSERALKRFSDVFSMVRSSKFPVGEMSVQCALCGIVMNEIEGFMSENRTEAELEKFLDDKVCAPLGEPKTAICDYFMSFLPEIIDQIISRNSVSTVCINLKFCSSNFPTYPDWDAIPVFDVSLDDPPATRWNKICSLPVYQKNAQYLYKIFSSLLSGAASEVEALGAYLNDNYFPAEYGAEIKGCSAALGIPYGYAAIFNLGYELSDACTSIIALTPSNQALHIRNLDFWAGMGFTEILRNMSFTANMQKAGKTVYTFSPIVGYFGSLSGIKPNEFSITINTRFYPEGFYELFYEVIAAIEEQNASLVSFLTRNVLANAGNYPTAVKTLSNTPLIADVYYTVAGKSEGVVLSRNRLNCSDTWSVNSQTKNWYVVQTNYDHWKQPPWFDDRVTPAVNTLNSIGRKNINFSQLAKVVSVKPVLNLQTVYTMEASPADNTYSVYTRWCDYPCAE